MNGTVDAYPDRLRYKSDPDVTDDGDVTLFTGTQSIDVVQSASVDVVNTGSAAIEFEVGHELYPTDNQQGGQRFGRAVQRPELAAGERQFFPTDQIGLPAGMMLPPDAVVRVFVNKISLDDGLSIEFNLQVARYFLSGKTPSAPSSRS